MYETLQASAPEFLEDPWQVAMDSLFEEKFGAIALAEQAENVTSLREEAVNFLGIAENLLGFRQAQIYAEQMCANHSHLNESVQGYMEQREQANNYGQQQNQNSASHPNRNNLNSDKKKKEKTKANAKDLKRRWSIFSLGSKAVSKT